MDNNEFIKALMAMNQQDNQRQPMSLGGDIGAGLAGIGKGILGSLPGPFGGMASKGVDMLHGALDNNITDQEKSISGYGQAAGAIGTAAFTGGATLASGVDDIATGLGTGVSQGSSFGKENQGAIQGIAGLAGGVGGLLTGDPNAGGQNMLGGLMGGMKSYGGRVQMANGGLTTIDNGGSHEQNPMGGVPLGENASVEQGETVMDMDDMSKFVFSDKIMDGKKSFAARSKTIEKKFEDRKGDAAATRAKDQQLKELAGRQEAIKAKKMAKLQSKMEALGGAPQMAPQGEVPGMPMQAKYGGRYKMTNGGFKPQQQANFDSYVTEYNKVMKNQGQNAYNGNTTDMASLAASMNPAANQGNVLNLNPGAVGTNSGAINPMEVAGNPSMSTTPTSPMSDELAKSNFESWNRELQSGMNKQAIADQAQHVRNRNLSIGAGSLLNSAGDIYNLAQGLQGPDNISLDRINPEELDLERQREMARRQNAAASAMQNENVRNFASSSGSALSSLSAGNAALNQTLSNQIAQSKLNEDTQNVGIRNRAEAQNQAISTQEQLLNLQAEAKAQDAIQAGISGIGGNAAQGLLDVRQSNQVDQTNDQQMNAMNSILKNFLVNKDGKVAWDFNKNSGK
jgi:hypothetical protein